MDESLIFYEKGTDIIKLPLNSSNESKISLQNFNLSKV